MTIESDIRTEYDDDLARTQLWVLVADEWRLIGQYEDHVLAEDALQSLVQWAHEHGCTKEVKPSLKIRKPAGLGQKTD